MAPQSALGLRRLRQGLLAKARGFTLEVGAGTALNASYYPASVTPILLECSPAMQRRATKRLRRLGLRYPLVAADAQALPFPDATFDTVLATFVLCTVPDAALGLREAARVLKPGGRLLLAEHVIMPNRVMAAFQCAINPLWGRFTAGCSLTRDTVRTVQEVGFAVHFTQRRWHGYLAVIHATKPPVIPSPDGSGRGLPPSEAKGISARL